jgi:two-component system, cell cycle response regulator DivK
MNRHPLRVLLVDDYPDALETWRLFLELADFEVVTASDGRMAVDVAVATQPDLIVMDLELPVMSGFEATRELRQRADTARIPVIAATGYSHFNALDQHRLAIFDVVVVKPCDPEQLLAHINRVLARPANAEHDDATEQRSAHNGQPGSLQPDPR